MNRSYFSTASGARKWCTLYKLSENLSCFENAPGLTSGDNVDSLALCRAGLFRHVPCENSED